MPAQLIRVHRQVRELALGERLFGQSNEVETVKLMFQYLGPPPANLLLRCAAKDKHFDELGTDFHSSGHFSAKHHRESQTWGA